MKTKFLSFVAGALSVLVLMTLSVSTLASDGSLFLKVFPIQILVNGQIFQPEDVNGQDVLVFTYNGTTYAPLRALAEAYDLEVGYDASNGIATVANPMPASQASGDFSSVWAIQERPVTHYDNEKVYIATYSGSLTIGEFKEWWNSLCDFRIAQEAEKLAAEVQSHNPGGTITMHFSYGAYNLGSAFACDGYQQSNFALASAWVQ